MAEPQLRYKAFLAAHQGTFKATPPNYLFFRWIRQQWDTFDSTNPDLPHSNRSAAFDQWLTLRYLSGQPNKQG